MALNLPLPSDFGVTADYVIITGVSIGLVNKATDIHLAGFASEESKKAGAKPLTTATVNLSGDKYTTETDVKKLYAILKALPDFKEARDA